MKDEATPLTLPEHLTQQFYSWEKRGRGWQIWDYPVVMEPPFRPFFHYLPSNLIPSYDDGQKPNFFVSCFQTIKDDFGEMIGLLKSRKSSNTSLPSAPPVSSSPCLSASPVATLPPELQEDTEPLACYGGDIIEMQVSLPVPFKIDIEIAKQFLLNLSYCSYPVSFEVIGLPDKVVIQIVCQGEDKITARQQLQAYFPEIMIQEGHNFFANHWWHIEDIDGNKVKENVVVDFGLANEFMLPLKVAKNLGIDPLIGIVGTLSNLQEGEMGMLQVLFQRVSYPWTESIWRSVRDWEGKSFFVDAPEITALAKEKISSPLFSVVIRVASQAKTKERAWEIVKNLGSSLTQFSQPNSNELMPLADDGYSDEKHQEDVSYRQTHRSGMLLNSEELVSLVHLPSSSVKSEKLRTKEKKTKALPSIAVGKELIIGENLHNNQTTLATFSLDQRIKHTYIIGASGTGKSTLLLNMIIQDIKNGQGIGVLDPHGDLIDQIIAYIPEDRYEDVILFDPSDEQYPIGFNILSAHSELEKNLLSSDLVSVFRRLSTSWGDQMTSVMGNGLLAFLESSEGGTLADLRRFLIEKEYRNSFLSTVKDPEIVYYWQKEFPLLRDKPQAPILTRLDTFLRPKIIRYIVSQPENKLNFQSIMNEGKIFLAKLAQGAIGEENAYLLGSLLVSKFHQAAMSRQQIEQAQRQPFFLYVDEFQDFVTPSMISILSGARKYHLGLILAHQELRQLWSRNPDLASSVLANPYTRICFRLGDEDAKKLAEGFSFFTSFDLQNLGTGEAICRIEKADYDFNLKTLPLSKIDQETETKRKEQIKTLSREKYGTKREEVEAELVKKYPQSQYSAVSIDKTQYGKLEEKIARQEPRKTFSTKATEKTSDISGENRERFILRETPKISRHTIAEPFLEGRGGLEHKRLQFLIKQMAEDKGYRAIIEKQVQTLNGVGSVDIALEKEGIYIACEISVTSTPEQEIGNIQKCLEARFSWIVLVANERKILNKLNALTQEKFNEPELTKLKFFTPDEFYHFLNELEAHALSGQETIIKGYKVITNFKAIPEEEQKTRRKSLIQTIVESWRRKKENKSKPNNKQG